MNFHAAEETFMFFRLFTKIALVGVVFGASVYAPLQAQQDSTAQVPTKSDRPFWIWQVLAKSQPGKIEESFNQRIAQDMNTDAPQFRSGSLIMAPLNIMWNHNRWISFAGYYFNGGFISGGSSRAGNFTITRNFHEVSWGVGYAIINTPRFRLYPALSATIATDIFTISQVTSLTALLSTTSSPRSINLQRNGSIYELAIGADYSFPLEYGDVYIMAKVGYNFDSANWESGGRQLTDTDSNWFSRRGIFFQIGVGFGTERH